MFIDFLIQNKLVSKEVVVEAIILQMESMPSLLRVLKNSEILNSNQIFDLLLASIKEEKTFYDVLQASGLVDESSLKKIVEDQNKESSSLGDILLEMNAIDRNTYGRALHEYGQRSKDQTPEVKEVVEHNDASVTLSAAALESLKEVNGVSEAEVQAMEVSASPSLSSAALESLKEVDNASADSLEASAQPTISSAALESLKEVNGINEKEIQSLSRNEESNSLESSWPVEESETEEASEVPEKFDSYLKAYDEEFQSQLYVVANRFRLKGKIADRNTLVERLKMILNEVNVLNLPFQQKLITPQLQLLDSYVEKPKEVVDKSRSLPMDMLEILWELRQSILFHGSEGHKMTDPKLKNNYIMILKNIMSFLKGEK